jgi:hypothetical protein
MHDILQQFINIKLYFYDIDLLLLSFLMFLLFGS